MKKIITGVFSVLFLLSAVTLSAQKEKEREKFEFVKEKSISKNSC